MRRCPESSPRAEALEERIALAVIAVTNTDDVGPGSLRQAILNSNSNNPADDTIVFDPTFFSTPRVIDVQAPLPQISGGGGLSIVGPGPAMLTVHKTSVGAPVYRRVFDSFARRFTMSGMTVTGGDIVGGNGGGLNLASGSDVTLDDMVITGNTANGNDGGGIFLGNNATLSIRNSVVTGNSARTGGGIFFFDGGSLVMENCTVSNNTAVSQTGRDVSGGGVYFFGLPLPSPPPGFLPNTLLIENSTFSGNTAHGAGGGFGSENLNGTLLVRNSTFSGNTAGSSGGAIHQTAAPATITVEDSTLTGNSAGGTVTGTNATGGGGICRDTIYPGALNVTNSVVSGNTNPLTPDILASTSTTVNVRYSAVGSGAGFTMSAASGNNLPFGAALLLGPLANNGGRTLTHAVPAGSPLVNAGSTALVPAGVVNDQRGPGFPRVVGASVDIGAFEAAAPSAAVVGRYVFYNNSSFDGNSPAAGAADDGAIAADKQALRPGGGTTFANVTSYSKGLNGVMLDVSGLAGTPTAADFEFWMSIPLGGVGWITAPAPTAIARRPAAGAGGSDRVTLVWADGAIMNRWLQVTVKSTANTGLAGGDRFYFGNLVGETGNAAATMSVNAIDLGQVRAAQLTPAPLTSRFDFNRDGRVNAVDLGLCRAAQLKSIPLFTAPGPIPPPSPPAGALLTSDPARERIDVNP